MKYKAFFLVICGNILEYYDFLLFAHLGVLIVPLFFDALSPNEARLLTLMFFGLPFLMRPLGGYVIGKISDKKGRELALLTAVKWSIIPSIGLALLPLPEKIGIISAFLFVCFRLFQGFALGGEYATAGTYLSETMKHKRGFISSILACSGNMGSLCAMAFAAICLQDNMPEGFWRVGFLLGGIAGFMAYRARRLLYLPPEKDVPVVSSSQLGFKIFTVLLIGILVGTTVWMPQVYTNYYITQKFAVDQHMLTLLTLFTLTLGLIITPLMGLLGDRFPLQRFMRYAALSVVPLMLFGFYAIVNQFFIIGQILLITAGASVNACVHPVINDFFPRSIRSRSVNLIFMTGLASGGILPSLSGLVMTYTKFEFFPVAFICIIAVATTWALWRLSTERPEIAITAETEPA